MSARERRGEERRERERERERERGGRARVRVVKGSSAMQTPYSPGSGGGGGANLNVMANTTERDNNNNNNNNNRKARKRNKFDKQEMEHTTTSDMDLDDDFDQRGGRGLEQRRPNLLSLLSNREVNTPKRNRYVSLPPPLAQLKRQIRANEGREEGHRRSSFSLSSPPPTPFFQKQRKVSVLSTTHFTRLLLLFY